MRIRIQESGGHRYRLTLPTRLVVNAVTATVCAKVFRDRDPVKGIDGRELRRWARELHRVRKKHPGLLLVDIESANGETVQIEL